MARISASSGCFFTHDYGVVKDRMESTVADGVEIIVYRVYINDLSKIVDTFSVFSKPIYAVHAPKVIQTLISQLHFQDKAEELILKTLDMAERMEAPIVVLHAWDGRFRELPLDDMVPLISKIANYAHQRDIALSIEALPSRFRHPALLLKEFLEKAPELSFTLDFEYAAAYDMFDELIGMADRMNNVHLRDFNGSWMINGKRAYLRPGAGFINFEERIRELRNNGFDSVYTIEAPYESVDELNKDIEYFRNII